MVLWFKTENKRKEKGRKDKEKQVVCFFFMLFGKNREIFFSLYLFGW